MINYPYEFIRQRIREDFNLTRADITDRNFSWRKIMKEMNDKVGDLLFDIKDEKLHLREIQVSFVSAEFTNYLINKNDNANDEFDLLQKCLLTKTKFLINLFQSSDEDRKDFNPKTKDYLSVYCNKSGWRFFLNEIDKTSIEVNDDTDPMLLEKAGQSFDLINKFLSAKEKELTDFSISPREIFDIQDRINSVFDKLENMYTQTANYLPSIAKEKKLETIFNNIINSKILSYSLKVQIESYIGDKGRKNGHTWFDRSFITSALIISSLKYYDESKVDYLVDLVLEHESRTNSNVWQKALSGIILCLLKVYRNEERIIVLISKIKTISANHWVREYLDFILLDLIGLSAERIYKNRKKYFVGAFWHFYPFDPDLKIITSPILEDSQQFKRTNFLYLISNSRTLTNFQKYKLAHNYYSLDKKITEEFVELLKSEEDEIKKDVSKPSLHLMWTIKNTILEEICYALNTGGNLDHVFSDILELRLNQLTFLKLFSEIFSNYFAAGCFFYEREEYKAAHAFLNKHLELYPNDINSLKKMGELYLEIDNHKLANSYFAKAIEVEPNNTTLLGQLGLNSINQNRPHVGIKYLEKAIEINPFHIRILELLGWSYFLIGDLNSAKKFSKKALEINGNDKNTLFNLGHIELFQQNYSSALKHYRKGVLLFEDVEQFNSEFEEDYKYFKDSDISHEKYLEIKNQLIAFLIKNEPV